MQGAGCRVRGMLSVLRLKIAEETDHAHAPGYLELQVGPRVRVISGSRLRVVGGLGSGFGV